MVTKHYRIKHKEQFADGRNHINGIENFWGLSKVKLVKFRVISRNTFYLHLKECEFRYNYKNQKIISIFVEKYQK